MQWEVHETISVVCSRLSSLSMSVNVNININLLLANYPSACRQFQRVVEWRKRETEVKSLEKNKSKRYVSDQPCQLQMVAASWLTQFQG